MEYGDIIEKIHDIENIETPSNLTEKEINEWICTIKKQDYINTSTKNIYFTVNKAKIFMNITTEVIKYAFDFSIMEAHGYLIKKYEEGCLAKINET